MRDTSTLAPRSRCLEALDFRDGPVFEPSTGLFVARTGHRYSWGRGTSTLASVAADGGPYTAPATLPGYEAVDGRLGVHLGTNDVLRGNTDVAWLPQTLSGELTFIERGARIATAGATLFAIANDAVSGVRLFLDTTGGASGFYRMTYHNGTTSVAATLTAGQPVAGQRVRLLWTWSAAGVTLAQSIAHGAFTHASSDPLALPAAFAAGAHVRIGRRGATVNPAALTLLSVLIAPGIVSATDWDEAY